MPFVVLEGLDGAGKSTQLSMLAQTLSQLDRENEFIHFPRFDTPVYGELIARFLRGELGTVDTVDPYIVALLFAGDRADAASALREKLSAGKWIIADRFVYSNIAFQCAKLNSEPKRKELMSWILNLEFCINALPSPDLTLFLDVPLTFTEKRLSHSREGEDRDYLKGASDIHEKSMDLQRNVREIYLNFFCDDQRYKIINCATDSGNMESPENIFAKIRAQVEPLIDKNANRGQL